MKKIITILILFVALGCTKKNNLEDNFINKNDYWAAYYQGSSGFFGNYFRFKKNGKSDEYCGDPNSISLCDGGDMIKTDIPWQVTSDSILRWGIKRFYVINSSEDVIVLYSGSKENTHIFLIKEYSGKLRKRRMYYEVKEKYLKDTNANKRQ